MANKSFKIFSLSILILVVLMSAVSATITFSNQVPSTLTQTSGTFDIDVTSDQTEDIDFTAVTITDYNGKEITFTPESESFDDETKTITITYTVDADFDFFGKEHTTTLTAEGSVSDNATITLTFEQTPFCEWDDGVDEDTDNDHIELQIKGIEVVEGFGEDEEWYPQDEIEVEIKVKNRNSEDDIDDIKIEWGIFDKDSGKWVIDVDDEKDFNLKDGDEEKKILSFKLDDLDEDFDELGNLIFYARATGDDDSIGEVCASDSKEVSIVTDDNFVILTNFEFLETTSCGSELHITADVWNIGDNQEDDVYVVVYNKELGINQKVEIGDLDEFEDERLDVIINIPEDAEEKYYEITFWVYDEGDDIYENDNDDEAEFNVLFKVEGSCIVEPQVSVYVSLESEARAGEDLIVRATVTNTGDESITSTLNVADYINWATLVNIEPSTIVLSEGNSKDILITLNVNKDVSGDKLFNIEILSEGKSIIKQPVSVTIEEQAGFNLAGITGNIISGNNWYLWGIGALNVLLIVVIIIVALRVAKKE